MHPDALGGALAAVCLTALEASAQPTPVPGMPPVPDPKNIYSEIGPTR
jgi:hypothetical protein